MELTDILNIVHPVSKESAKRLQQYCTPVSFDKKELIIKDNEVDQYIYIIKGGIVRCGFRHGEMEDTVLFGMEGDAIGAVHSLKHDLPSPFFYEAITKVDALKIHIDDFNSLIKIDHELLMWWQAYLFDGMFVFEHKYAYFAMKDAYERYITFLGKRPELAKEIPVKYIAQYLNISRETLSRIRAKYAKD